MTQGMADKQVGNLQNQEVTETREEMSISK